MDDDRTTALEDLADDLADAKRAIDLADYAARAAYGIETVNEAKRCPELQRIRRVQEELQRLVDEFGRR